MKILLNILTHGDELIGLKVAEEIKKLNINDQIITIQIANPEAYEQGKRFVDQDLNRAFPGKPNGNYEQRRAHQLLPVIKAADIVIDIHSTTSQLRDALIVTKLDEPTLKCIRAIQPKYALVMEATGNQALISHAAIGLAFEYGQEGSQAVVSKVVEGIKRLLHAVGAIDQSPSAKNTQTKYFRVTSEVKKSPGFQLLDHIKNYTIVRQGEVYAVKGNHKLTATEDFYPILFGQDNYEDIFGFKGAKLNQLARTSIGSADRSAEKQGE